MKILAKLSDPNLFSTLISTPHPNTPFSHPPIPIPKYPPLKSRKHPPPHSPKPQSSTTAFKTHHQRSKYSKPVKDGVISSDGARSVVVGVSYLLPCASFEFKFSYSEIPKAKPVAILKPPFLPFAPPSMARPWKEKAPMKSAQEKKIALFELVDSEGSSRVMRFETARPYRLGNYAATEVRPREER
ncbi:RNA-binding CRS1 / YhbY (CRM) domain-containing protein [Actinidia rufa]|uniref:RNA-binding CRS1 / YhbY (CRM) domain-containing protein n=1 Tax=Actinidia rufa TaxID=165716 RepID=A0A7J0EDS7_9ERIC|nr:RNA-binding CRS1 / YhbY (CRM) domain-containing protein [Actinidia rufa]